jgi:hypothetical protein
MLEVEKRQRERQNRPEDGRWQATVSEVVVLLRWQAGQRRGRIQYANRRRANSLTNETGAGAV